MDNKTDNRDIEACDVNHANYDEVNELYANDKSANTYDKLNKTKYVDNNKYQ